MAEIIWMSEEEIDKLNAAPTEEEIIQEQIDTLALQILDFIGV